VVGEASHREVALAAGDQIAGLLDDLLGARCADGLLGDGPRLALT